MFLYFSTTWFLLKSNPWTISALKKMLFCYSYMRNSWAVSQISTTVSLHPQKFPQALWPSFTKLCQINGLVVACPTSIYKFPTFLPQNSDDIFSGWGNQIQLKRLFIYIATYISVYKTADLRLKNITPELSNKKSFRSMGLQISIIASGAVADVCSLPLWYEPWKINGWNLQPSPI